MDSKKKITNNFIWRFLERCGAQGVTFLVSVILARLLDTSVYGTVALITVFTSILQVFVSSGMGVALVQKKNADDLDFSTLFWFNIVMCLFLYTLLFLCAPLIASFYSNPDLTPLIRVLGIVLLISGVKNIQLSYVSRNMIFKKFFFATLGGTLFAAVIGIYMAYKGYGVWALIAQNLANQFMDTVILWITVPWRPKRKFSFQRLKILFSYGWKLLASSLLDTVYNELRQLIIGKRYSSNDLAFYNQGKKYPAFFVANINSSIDSILLPTISSAQDNPPAVKNMTRRAIKVSSYLLMPLMAGLIACAHPFISLLVTDKWLPCVPYLRIFCVSFAFYPIHTANLNAIKAMGRSDIFLKLEIMKKAVGMVLLLSTMWISVEAMAYSLLVSTFTSQLINSWPNKKLLNYSYREQLTDMLPHIGLSAAMCAVIWPIQYLHLHSAVTLGIQIPVAVVFYYLGSRILRIETLGYILSILRSYRHRQKPGSEP